MRALVCECGSAHSLLRTSGPCPELPWGCSRRVDHVRFSPCPDGPRDTGNRGQVLHFGRQVQFRQGRHPAGGARGTRAGPRGLRRQQQDSHPERGRKSEFRPDLRRHRGRSGQGRQGGTAGRRPGIPVGGRPRAERLGHQRQPRQGREDQPRRRGDDDQHHLAQRRGPRHRTRRRQRLGSVRPEGRPAGRLRILRVHLDAEDRQHPRGRQGRQDHHHGSHRRPGPQRRRNHPRRRRPALPARQRPRGQ